MFEILVWCVLMACALSPVRAGQCILLARVDLFEGLRRLPGIVSTQVGVPLVSALVGAFLLAFLARYKAKDEQVKSIGSDWTFDRCLDGCMYMLVPYLVLVSLGLVLEQSGLRWWFLPHRAFRGSGVYLFVRIMVAFGWSAGLYLYVLRKLWLNVAESEDPSESV